MNDKQNGDVVESMISQSTAETLLRGYSNANPGKILNSEEFSLILKWAEGVEIGNAILEGVLDGDILPSVNDEGEVTFSVSAKGLSSAKNKETTTMKLPNSDKIQ